MNTDQKMDLILSRLDKIDSRLDTIESRLSNVEKTLSEHTATLKEHGHDIKAILAWIPHSDENVKTISRLSKPAMAAKSKI